MAKRGPKKIKLTSEQIAVVEEEAGKGMNLIDIAHMIGLGKSAFFERLNEIPELADAVQRGRVQRRSKVTGVLQELIDGVEVEKETKDGPKVYTTPPNVKAVTFYLEKQGGEGWQRTVQIEGNPEKPLEVRSEPVKRENVIKAIEILAECGVRVGDQKGDAKDQ